MKYRLTPAPAVEPIALLDMPREFETLDLAVLHAAEQARASIDLAQERREQLQVIELDNPTTTTFALFL